MIIAKSLLSFYNDVKVDEHYLDNEMETDQAESLQEGIVEQEITTFDDEEDERLGFGTNAKTLTNADTCLVPNHLESEVVVAGEQSEAASKIEIAPGNEFRNYL